MQRDYIAFYKIAMTAISMDLVFEQLFETIFKKLFVCQRVMGPKFCQHVSLPPSPGWPPSSHSGQS